MKKILSLRNALIWLCALLAIVGFFVAFSASFMTVAESQGTVTITMEAIITNVIIGEQRAKVLFIDTKVEPEEQIKSIISLIGIIIALVSGIGLAVASFLLKEGTLKKSLIIIGGILILAGTVSVALVRVGATLYRQSVTGTSYDEVWEQVTSKCQVNGGVIATAVLLGLSSVSAFASLFIPVKSEAKQ